MLRQVGEELVLDDKGLAVRGMVVRHMVLPEGLAGTVDVLRWIADELSSNVCVSLMDQYFPAHRAVGDPVLGRKITRGEYKAALDALDAFGLEHGWRQNTTDDE
jgi:putative pyruvate formate lyase activating enzyme